MLRQCYNIIKNIIKRNLHEFRIDTNSRILVISPHPDDESIGMGGFLSKYKNNCDVVLVTNGALGNPEWSKEKTIEIRRQEFIDALTYIGIQNYYMLEIMDQEANRNLACLKQVLNKKYDYIFVPNRHDIHPDHNCLYRCVKRYIKRKRLDCLLVEYEVWTPLERPNFYLDISACFQEKEEAVKKYVSQIKHAKYDWGSLGLNRYRGMLSGVSYAEAYFINKPILDRIVDKIMYRVNIMRKKKR